MSTSSHAQPWWKSSVVYQIYPASFYCAPDSKAPPNDAKNAVGNIRGIIEKVPYIASLGFDAIWLSPIFASPQTDMGYDISDYRSIHAPYGTVQDLQDLINAMHATRIDEPNGQARPMRLLLDLVVNHTSDQHPWFIESASSPTSSKSDWYFWRNPKVLADGSRAEPNNWRSIFGGPAWHYVESRKQYYLALFLPSQPDLNWENAAMREEIYSDMKFWLDRGVDGWRIDSMNLMSKHPELPDAEVTQPDEKYQDGKKFYASGPKMHEYLQEIRHRVFDTYGENKLFTVGELGSVESEESVAQYVSPSRKELDCVFAGMDFDFGPGGKYDSSDPFRVEKLRKATDKWQTTMPKFQGWNTIYLDNHDSGRSISRYMGDADKSLESRELAAKLLATYLCTLSGTIFTLAGQEIGMTNLPASTGIESYIDVEGQNWYHKMLTERNLSNQPPSKINAEMQDVMQQIQLKSRDHGRLPMQWKRNVANAGFCPAEWTPWMTMHPDILDQDTKWTVDAQLNDPHSVLTYWKNLISFRRKHESAFVHGQYTPLDEKTCGENVIGYERSSLSSSSSSSSSSTTSNPTSSTLSENDTFVIFLNFSSQSSTISSDRYDEWTVAFQNYSSVDARDGRLVLRPYEALVLKK